MSAPDAPATDLNSAVLARDESHERWRIFSLSAPAATLVGLLLVIPVGWLFALSFVEDTSLSLAHYQRMIEFPAYFQIIRTTIEISLLVTVICILLGYPVAYLLAQLPDRLAAAGLALVAIPFWTSLLVRTYAWLVLLQRRGLINTWLGQWGAIDEPLRLVHNYTGTVIGMVHIMLPFLILPLYAALKAIDPDLMRAAANLGAAPARAFLAVFVPLSLPGLVAGTLLVFILCLGFYVTPQILGGGRVMMVSMKIEENIAVYFDWGAASSLGVVLLLAVLLIFALISRGAGLDRLWRS